MAFGRLCIWNLGIWYPIQQTPTGPISYSGTSRRLILLLFPTAHRKPETAWSFRRAVLPIRRATPFPTSGKGRLIPGAYVQLGITTAKTFTDTVPTSGTTYTARVKAVDANGLESGYCTGSAKSYFLQHAARDQRFGSKPGIKKQRRLHTQYTVTDAQAATQTITVTEKPTNGTQTIALRTYTATSGAQNTVDLSSVGFRFFPEPSPDDHGHRQRRRKRNAKDHIQPYRQPYRGGARVQYGRPGSEGLCFPLSGDDSGRRHPFTWKSRTTRSTLRRCG